MDAEKRKGQKEIHHLSRHLQPLVLKIVIWMSYETCCYGVGFMFSLFYFVTIIPSLVCNFTSCHLLQSKPVGNHRFWLSALISFTCSSLVLTSFFVHSSVFGDFLPGFSFLVCHLDFVFFFLFLFPGGFVFSFGLVNLVFTWACLTFKSFCMLTFV